ERFGSHSRISAKRAEKIVSDSLTVVAEGRVMGEVVLRGDRLSFRYEPDWQASENAFPLSLSMPLIVREHGRRVVEAFL
ncbi:MAG TPA: HipA N-terminal domain-containing protein, partial [Terrimicrobiaceae bacterium]